jgi:hypothetical protein
MFNLFGKSKPLSHIETLYLEKDLSLAKKIRYILELEGSICTLDPNLNKNGNLRKVVHRLKKEKNTDIYKEECSCDFTCEFREKAPLNKDGTPRKHYSYKKDWAS